MNKMTKEEFIQLISKAKEAADIAGDEWMAIELSHRPQIEVIDQLTGKVIGEMLDVCGMAWIEVADARSSTGRMFKNAGLISFGSRRIVNITYKWAFRQEYGLHKACNRAIIEYLSKNGINGLVLKHCID